MPRFSIGPWFFLLPTALLLATAVPVLAQAPAVCDAAASNPTGPIAATVGQPFAFKLDSNRTTGYSWTITQPADAAIATSNGDSTYIPPQQQLAGTGGQECFTFTAVAPGTTTVELAYRRPFDPSSTPPAQTATVTINVAASGAGAQPAAGQAGGAQPGGSGPSVPAQLPIAGEQA